MLQAKIKRTLEIRTINEKGLEERRNELIIEMEAIVSKSDEEQRALTEEEVNQFNEKEKEVKEIDDTLEAKEKARNLATKKNDKKKSGKDGEQRSLEELQEEELRVALNTGTPNEGGLAVGEVLSKEIIKDIKDRSAVYSFFDATSVKGEYRILKKTSTCTATWTPEGTTPDTTDKAKIPTFSSDVLKQHRLYRESAITQQMLNTQEINLSAEIKTDISESMVDAIEEAIFNGTGSEQPTGIIKGITKKHTLATRGALTVDDLKKCKAKIKKAGRKKAKWFMHSDTLLVVDLLKDNDGRPLLQPDLTKESDYLLLGYPVETSDALPTLETSGAACVVIFAGPHAYHTNTQKQIVLNTYEDSTYKRAGLIGYGSDMYMDGKTKNPDLVAGVFNKSV